MATSSNKIDPNAPRIFLDSSVLLAGLGSRKGASYAILVLSDVGLVRPVVCPYVLDEVERNVLTKFPAYQPEYQRLRTEIAWEIVPDPTVEQVKHYLGLIVAKDAPVIAAAANANPKRLVTLDTSDFLRDPAIATISGVAICTPRTILQEIRAAIAKGF